jgi:hypothetical protein
MIFSGLSTTELSRYTHVQSGWRTTGGNQRRFASQIDEIAIDLSSREPTESLWCNLSTAQQRWLDKEIMVHETTNKEPDPNRSHSMPALALVATLAAVVEYVHDK